MTMNSHAPLGMDPRIDAILVAAIDPHVHSGASIALQAVDHLELARAMSDAGFAAVITKDNDYSGVMTAALIARHNPDLPTRVYSGITLNNAVGGLNLYAVEHTAAMGGKIVVMPTLAAENHLRWEKQANWSHPASTQKMRGATPVHVLDSTGAVLDAAKEVLDIVAKNDMALASGHLHVTETWKIFEEAQKRGVKRLIFTHPEEIRRREPQRCEGHFRHGRLRRALTVHVPGGVEVQGRRPRRDAPAYRGGGRRADDPVLGPRAARCLQPSGRLPARRQDVS